MFFLMEPLPPTIFFFCWNIVSAECPVIDVSKSKPFAEKAKINVLLTQVFITVIMLQRCYNKRQNLNVLIFCWNLFHSHTYAKEIGDGGDVL